MKKAVHISLLVFTVLVLVTGYGITQYRTVEKITFGVLTKSLAFYLHGPLAVIFIVLLAAHIAITYRERK